MEKMTIKGLRLDPENNRILLNIELFWEWEQGKNEENSSFWEKRNQIVCFLIGSYAMYEELPPEMTVKELAKDLLLEYPPLEKVSIELWKPNPRVELAEVMGMSVEAVSLKGEQSWHTAYVAVGSNMGEKEAYIEQAVKELEEIPEIKLEKVSDLIVTKPYGGVEQDDFVNGAIKLRTLFTPTELLCALHEVEAHANRKRLIRWGPRTLDLDIIFYDNLVYEDDELIIPHVDMQNRSFVLKPLLELCPNKRHPILGKTVTQLYAQLEQESKRQETV